MSSVFDPVVLLRFRFLNLFRDRECIDIAELESAVSGQGVSPQVAKLAIADLVEVRDGKACLSEYGKQLIKLITSVG